MTDEVEATEGLSEAQSKLLGSILGEISRAEQDPEHPLNRRRSLVNPGCTTQRYWIGTWIAEVKGALDAHMEVYASSSVVGISGGNPGHWDLESSWYALQTIVNELSAHTVSMFTGISRIQIPADVWWAVQVIKAYLEVSRQMPLGREGATTNHDSAKYAKLLTTAISTVVELGYTPDPQKVWHQWKKHYFL